MSGSPPLAAKPRRAALAPSPERALRHFQLGCWRYSPPGVETSHRDNAAGHCIAHSTIHQPSHELRGPRQCALATSSRQQSCAIDRGTKWLLGTTRTRLRPSWHQPPAFSPGTRARHFELPSKVPYLSGQGSDIYAACQ